MTPTAAALSSILPAAPKNLEDTGLDFETLTDLVLKTLHRSVGSTGGELARRMGVPFGVIERSLEHLRALQLSEIAGGSIMGGSAFRYRLTDRGHERALRAHEINQYSGIAPVPLAQYRHYMSAFSQRAAKAVPSADVHRAFEDLVVSRQVLDELGPAINARHSIFIYGPPGNGKTVMAQHIRRLLGGTLAVPYALDVNGHIIRFFDPSLHEPVHPDEADVDATDGVSRFDRRWVHCRRPTVTVGGELTLEALSLRFDPRAGTYRAPVQTLANGGVLVIDDFGRQQCPPRDLLNWWMVPLESRVEYMTLGSGEKIEMPFEALVIFSTNIRPSDLVDEAFLRRIRHKIYAGNPSIDAFTEIFRRCCDARRVPFERAHVEYLLDTVYGPRRLPLRACQPRDLIDHALALAEYRGEPRVLTHDLLDAACAGYFLVDDTATASDL